METPHPTPQPTVVLQAEGLYLLTHLTNVCSEHTQHMQDTAGPKDQTLKERVGKLGRNEQNPNYT